MIIEKIQYSQTYTNLIKKKNKIRKFFKKNLNKSTLIMYFDIMIVHYSLSRYFDHLMKLGPIIT